MTAGSAGPKVILENMDSELGSTYPELAEKPFAVNITISQRGSCYFNF